MSTVQNTVRRGNHEMHLKKARIRLVRLLLSTILSDRVPQYEFFADFTEQAIIKYLRPLVAATTRHRRVHE